MREQEPNFEAQGVHVACVVQGNAEEAARFCGRHGVESLCVPDPDKSSYRAMGFGRTSWKEMIFPSDDLKSRRAEAKEAGCSVDVKGAVQKHSDILQLPGAALMARGGKILWLHRGTHTGDLPSAAELVSVVKSHLETAGEL